MNRTTVNTWLYASAAALCLAAGCATQPAMIEQRILQRADAFEALAPEARERLRLAHVEAGDSTNFLWMAFGDPTLVDYKMPDGSLVTRSAASPEDALSPPPEGYAGETWTYVRTSQPVTAEQRFAQARIGQDLPFQPYQPGAAFAAVPAQPAMRSTKVFTIADGVITHIDTKVETLGDAP